MFCDKEKKSCKIKLKYQVQNEKVETGGFMS